MNLFMKKLILAAALIFSICISPLSAQKENLYNFHLENGLNIFVQENHSIPLAFIEIAVRCGSINQEKDQTGIFNLYREMLMKGNGKYRSSADVSKALADLGVSDCSGITEKEYTAFSFTIPSDKLSQGIEFLSAAIRTPKFDKRELENQKKIMISQLDLKKQQSKLEDFIDSRLFQEVPWKADCYGTKESIEKINVRQLKDIQKEYYVPNNTAIFIGGDVNPEEVKKIILKHFGNWRKSKSNWIQTFPFLNQKPLSATEYYVYPTNEVSEQNAAVYVSFRGPDAEKNSTIAVVQNLLFSIMENPEGMFKKSYMLNENLGITDSDSIKIDSKLSGFTSVITLKADFLVPEQYLPERVKLFSEELSPNMDRIFNQGDSGIEREIEKAKKREEYRLLFQAQSPRTFLSVLRDGWTATGSDFYTSYLYKTQLTTQIDLESFYKEYISEINQIVIVCVNPEIYSNSRQKFADEGFMEIK